MDHALHARNIASDLHRANSVAGKLEVLSREFEFFWSLPDECEPPPGVDADRDWSPHELPQWRSVRDAKLLRSMVDIVASPARKVSGVVTEADRSLRTLVFRILGGIINLQDTGSSKSLISLVVLKLPAIMDQYRIVYQSSREQTEKSRGLGIRSAIVAIFSYVYFSLPRDDKGFFKLVETNTFLWLLFDRIFDPLEKFESRSDLGQLVCDMFLDMLNEPLPLDLVDQRFLSKLSAKYGTQHIANTCLSWMSTYPNLGGARKLLCCVLSCHSTQVQLIRRHSVHIGMSIPQWKAVGRDTSGSSTSFGFSQANVGLNYLEDIVSMIELIESRSLKVEVVEDLIQKDDLMLLMGRVVLWRYRDRAGRLRYDLETIAELCLDRPALMKSHVEPYWSFVFRRLSAVWYNPEDVLQQVELERVYTNPDGNMQEFKSALELWRWLARKLKLNLIMLSWDDISCRRQTLGVLVGCSWVRCPLFGVDLASELQRPILLCSICKKVQYCSFACQKSHWVHGHQTECTSAPIPVES